MTVKKGRTQTYILKGEPEALFLRRSEDIIGWNNHKEKKIITDISFETQHNDMPLFSGALAFDAIFYFRTPIKVTSRVKARDGDFQSKVPSVLMLFNFLEHSAKGIIFAETGNIAQLSAVKLYDSEPRTVFTITELYGKKES